MLLDTDYVVIARGVNNYRVSIADLKIAIGAGAPGVNGRDGASIFSLDGEDASEPMMIPGTQGIAGVSGLAGAPGVTIIGLDGNDGDDFHYPGVKGDQGIQGVPGAPGSGGGSSTPIWLPSHDDYGTPEDTVPLYTPDTKNWVYLGQITGTGVTVGPLIWTQDFLKIYFEYQIGGYNGGTPIGRLMCGSAAITTTGLTNGNGLRSGVTLNATSVSKPGVPLAITASNIARHGYGIIQGLSGAIKKIKIHGANGNPAVATSPTQFEADSFFSDLGTNLLIKRLQLTVYDTLIATAVSAQTFTATTYIKAWGIRQFS
jgi:hypothetical protein